MIFFDPLNEFFKSKLGAVSEACNVTFRVKGNFDSVIFVFIKDNSKEKFFFNTKRIDDYFECNVNLSTGLYWYYIDIGNGKYLSFDENNYIAKISNQINYFQYSVYDKDFCTPKWIKGGIIYQIFPDRFFSSNKNTFNTNDRFIHNNKSDMPFYKPNENGKVLNNDFFGGDLLGIKEKIDYLKSLNVTAIYLNPIFKANSNHRYDTGNYLEIDELLGSISDFQDLVLECDKNGIKIILDGVFNHTGDDSLYFNKYNRYNSLGAYQSQNSPYYDWYSFTEFPNKYKSWWGVDILPTINKESKNFIDYISGDNGVLEYYLKKGVFGWRLDVVDELPSAFLKQIRSRIKATNSDAFIIGEVWEDASNKISYDVRREYFLGKELDSVMNYPLKDAIIQFVLGENFNNLLYVIKSQMDRYPSCVLNCLMNILSTHDTIRIIDVFGLDNKINMTKDEMSTYSLDFDKRRKAIDRLKIASILQFTIYGVPSIYYGDEIGLEGLIDPFNRRFFPWNNIDDEILEWYKLISNIRLTYSAFENGKLSIIYYNNGAFVFKRYDESSEILIGVNCSNSCLYLSFYGSLYNVIDKTYYKEEYELKPNSACIFINAIKNC